MHLEQKKASSGCIQTFQSSIRMHLRDKKATSQIKELKVVYKRLEAEKTGRYEAKSKEATEMRTQQQCILSGEVHLRHRLEK